MLTFMMLGGPLMWLILACGIIALAVFLERALHLHRARIKTDDFLRGIANILSRNNITEAMTICDETPGPVAAIARAAIHHNNEPPESVRQAIDQTALAEIGRMERRAGVLSVIAHIAPLLGLLGTIIGLIQVFIAIQQRAPLVHAGDLAGGMWQALLTAAAGLGIAIIAMVAHSLVMSKIDALALDMEQSAGDIVALTAMVPGKLDGTT